MADVTEAERYVASLIRQRDLYSAVVETLTMYCVKCDGIGRRYWTDSATGERCQAECDTCGGLCRVPRNAARLTAAECALYIVRDIAQRFPCAKDRRALANCDDPTCAPCDVRHKLAAYDEALRNEQEQPLNPPAKS